MAVKWHNTGRSVRFFGVDGKALFLLVLMIYHVALWTFVTAVAGITVLVLLERRGYSIPNALRRLRLFLVGNHRRAIVGRRLGRMDR